MTAGRERLAISLIAIVLYWLVRIGLRGTNGRVPAEFSEFVFNVTVNKLAVFLGIWALLRIEGEGFDRLGVARAEAPRRVAIGVAIGALMFVAFNVALNSVMSELLPKPRGQGPSLMAHFADPRNLIIWLPIGVIGGGVVEELERIFVITRFEKWLGKIGVVLGVVLSSVAFGLGHLYQGPGTAIATGISGLVLALVYLKRRSAVMAMSAHAFSDVLAILAATLLAQSPVDASNRSATVRHPIVRADERGPLHRCLSISDSSGTPVRDYEPHAARDPKNPDRMIAAWMTRGRPYGTISVASSSDGGISWTTPKVLGFNACAGGPPGAVRASDPWTAIGPDGRAYVAALAFEMDSSGNTTHSEVVVFSSTNGSTWGPRISAVASDVKAAMYDNVAIVADPTRAGVVYLTTTRYGIGPNAGGPVGFTRSSDGGVTWEPLRTVSPERPGGRASAPEIAVNPRTGTLHLLYFEESSAGAAILTKVSRDGGTTWSGERTVAPFVRLLKYPTTRIRLGDVLPIITAQDIVHGVVDAESGIVYVAYADGASTGGGQLQVMLTWSADGGETWQPPRRVSSRTDTHAWLPSIAISDDRRLGILYLDTRDWRPDSVGAVPTTVALVTASLTASGPRQVSERVLDAYNMRGSGRTDFGTGDYQALVGLKASFGAVYVRPTCPVTAPLCAFVGRSLTELVFR